MKTVISNITVSGTAPTREPQAFNPVGPACMN